MPPISIPTHWQQQQKTLGGHCLEQSRNQRTFLHLCPVRWLKRGSSAARQQLFSRWCWIHERAGARLQCVYALLTLFTLFCIITRDATLLSVSECRADRSGSMWREQRGEVWDIVDAWLSFKSDEAFLVSPRREMRREKNWQADRKQSVLVRSHDEGRDKIQAGRESGQARGSIYKLLPRQQRQASRSALFPSSSSCD